MAAFRIISPSVEPISVDELKLHARVLGADEDLLLALYIAAAREKAESLTNRALITQTWRQLHDRFPPDALQLQRPDVLAISAVSYLDADAATITLPETAYCLDATTLPGWLLPAAGTSWPSTGAFVNAVTVDYACGFGASAASVPAAIRTWLLLAATQMYEHRTPVDITGKVVALPSRYFDSLLDPHIVYGL